MKPKIKIFVCHCGESTIEAFSIIGGTCPFCESALLPVAVEKIRQKGQTVRQVARALALSKVAERMGQQ